MTSWLDYLYEFWFLLPVVMLAAPALFVAGAQALAQSKTLDIFILVQGTIVGHLIALALGIEGQGELLLCYLFAAVVIFISHLFGRIVTVYQSALRIGFYAFLLVSVYIFERWIPGLERHVNSAIVGDLLFLNHKEVIMLVAVVIFYIIYNFLSLEAHSRRFFSHKVLKIHQKASPIWFVCNFLLLVSGTHFLGLSFILGFAVIVPLCLCLGLSDKAQKAFFVLGAISSALLAGSSLLVSFALPNQSTSPLLVILSVGTLTLLLTGRHYVHKFKA